MTCRYDSLRAPLVFDPGERWEYGIGIDWAGRIIEIVSGLSLGEYLEKHFFTPLAMGDTDWFALLGRHHQLVSTHVKAHRGRIVKNQGDGYMLCFRSAHQALLAGIGMQRDLARLGPSLLPEEPDSPDNRRLRVRMGAHTGEVLMQPEKALFKTPGPTIRQVL